MKQESSIGILEQFLPSGAFAEIAPFFKTHTIHLTLTHERKSVLGDYRNPTKDEPFHRISINLNLNKYNFLLTLLHELAHMITYIHFKHNVLPHGDEWKMEFRKVLVPFISKKFFPPDVERALLAYLKNPAASTCTDPSLYKALYRYDAKRPGYKLVDEIQINQKFKTADGQEFLKLEKRRTRSRCQNIKTGKFFLFPGIAEVELLD
jgi:hypothetical protein